MSEPVVIVTGASRGLGAAVARIVAATGAPVVLSARSADQMHSVAQSIRAAGGSVLAVAGDISDPVVCRSIVELAIANFGRIDAIVNNAGIIEPLTPIAAAQLADWQLTLTVNVLGPVLLTRTAIPYLRAQRGRVINVSSGLAVKARVAMGAYCASKAALNMFTSVLALEEPRITALALRPGAVDTAMQTVIRETGTTHMAPTDHQYFSDRHQQGTLLSPEQPAGAIAGLALHAPHEWSGEFVQWDEERVQALSATL